MLVISIEQSTVYIYIYAGYINRAVYWVYIDAGYINRVVYWVYIYMVVISIQSTGYI